MRFNTNGTPKEDLKWVLLRPDLVAFQKRRNICFLCCSAGVNDAGLCEVCMNYLNDSDFELAQKILRGQSF